MCNIRLSACQLTLFVAEAERLVEEDRDIDAVASDAIQQQVNTLPQSLDGLERARDTVLWRLEASAHELAVILRERRTNQRSLQALDEAILGLEGAQGEAGGSGGAAGEDEASGEEGSGEGGFEDEDDVDEQLA